MILYGIDFVLVLSQIAWLKNKYAESLCIMFLRYVLLIVVVGYLISGNVEYYKPQSMEGCKGL